MRAVRERPRLVAARALAVIVLVGIGIAVGALLDGAGVPPQVESQLLRAKTASGERASRLERTSVELQSVRAELDAAIVRARSSTRTNSRLRRAVREAKRDLRRAQRARRSRSR